MSKPNGWDWKGRPRRGEHGFGLVEVLVAAGLLVIVIGGVYQYFLYGYASSRRAFAEARAAQEVRLVLQRMDAEVRQARISTDEGQALVVAPGGKQVDIYTDVNGDGKPEMVSYRLRDGRLECGVATTTSERFPYSFAAPGDWETVARSVSDDSIFSVPDFDGDPDTPNAREALRVQIQVGDGVRPLEIDATLTVRSPKEID